MGKQYYVKLVQYNIKSELMKDGGCHQKASRLKTSLVSNMLNTISLVHVCTI